MEKKDWLPFKYLIIKKFTLFFFFCLFLLKLIFKINGKGYSDYLVIIITQYNF
jgi:hypothetical protein